MKRKRYAFSWLLLFYFSITSAQLRKLIWVGPRMYQVTGTGDKVEIIGSTTSLPDLNADDVRGLISLFSSVWPYSIVPLLG